MSYIQLNGLLYEANLFNMIPSFVPFDTAFKDTSANKNAIDGFAFWMTFYP